MTHRVPTSKEGASFLNCQRSFLRSSPVCVASLLTQLHTSPPPLAVPSAWRRGGPSIRGRARRRLSELQQRVWACVTAVLSCCASGSVAVEHLCTGDPWSSALRRCNNHKHYKCVSLHPRNTFWLQSLQGRVAAQAEHSCTRDPRSCAISRGLARHVCTGDESAYVCSWFCVRAGGDWALCLHLLGPFQAYACSAVAVSASVVLSFSQLGADQRAAEMHATQPPLSSGRAKCWPVWKGCSWGGSELWLRQSWFGTAGLPSCVGPANKNRRLIKKTLIMSQKGRQQ